MPHDDPTAPLVVPAHAGVIRWPRRRPIRWPLDRRASGEPTVSGRCARRSATAGASQSRPTLAVGCPTFARFSSTATQTFNGSSGRTRRSPASPDFCDHGVSPRPGTAEGPPQLGQPLLSDFRVTPRRARSPSRHRRTTCSPPGRSSDAGRSPASPPGRKATSPYGGPRLSLRRASSSDASG